MRGVACDVCDATVGSVVMRVERQVVFTDGDDVYRSTLLTHETLPSYDVCSPRCLITLADRLDAHAAGRTEP